MAQHYAQSIAKSPRFDDVIQSFHAESSKHVFLFAAHSSELLMHVSLLFNALCNAKQIPLITLSVREKSLHDIKEILESSFLGQNNWYAIYDLEQHAKNSATTLLNYLLQYTGPHRIIVCYSAESAHAGLLQKQSIELPVELSVQQVADFGLPTRVCNIQTIQLLLAKNNLFSLASFLSALPYVPVLGKLLVPSFQEQYLPRLVKTEVGSLFTFTDLFWQRKSTAFYEQWAHLKQIYVPQFWITFWSDQLFRASCYAVSMRAKENAVAQQIAARKLSFWYIKSGWQNIDANLLATLHDLLYTIDYRSKTGGDTEMIEYIYQRWFNRS